MTRPMKDGLNPASLSRLRDAVAASHPGFDAHGFLTDALQGLDALELKERVRHISTVLATHLPPPFLEALAVVRRCAEHWDAGDPDDALRGFAAWPLFQFIEERGLGHVDASLDALEELTQLFTAEFAVRPFLQREPARTWSRITKWTDHPNEHVRRLASECSRPRLPWATKVAALIDDPNPGLRTLRRLLDDPSPYVRRSVANHLNDVAKDHPDQVVAFCTETLASETPERRWIVERATRTLIKDGNPGAFALLGFAPRPRLEARLNVGPSQVRLGSSLNFELTLEGRSSAPQKLAVDYALHLMKKNGTTRPKVFKWKVMSLQAGQATVLSKRHPMKKITTRSYYPGQQKLEILVNGKPIAYAHFELSTQD